MKTEEVIKILYEVRAELSVFEDVINDHIYDLKLQSEKVINGLLGDIKKMEGAKSIMVKRVKTKNGQIYTVDQLTRSTEGAFKVWKIEVLCRGDVLTAYDMAGNKIEWSDQPAAPVADVGTDGSAPGDPPPVPDEKELAPEPELPTADDAADPAPGGPSEDPDVGVVMKKFNDFIGVGFSRDRAAVQTAVEFGLEVATVKEIVGSEPEKENAEK